MKEKLTGRSFKEDTIKTQNQTNVKTTPNIRPQTFEVDDLLLPVHSISLGDSDELDKEIF